MDGSPPVSEEGVEMDVVLVDMSPDILDHLTLVADFSGPTDLLHLFLDDPFVYPVREDLLAAAWEWLTHPEGGDRLHYYSAAEAGETEEEMIPEVPSNGPKPLIQPGAKPAATPTPGGRKPRVANQQEDPPSGLFTNRSLAPLSRGRSFAPLADQRWVATALSFIKELDLITQRRADVTSTKASSSMDGQVVTPKTKPKPQAKGAWKKKQKQITDGAEV